MFLVAANFLRLFKWLFKDDGCLQLDKKLLTTYFKENEVDEVPSFANQVLDSFTVLLKSWFHSILLIVTVKRRFSWLLFQIYWAVHFAGSSATSM